MAIGIRSGAAITDLDSIFDLIISGMTPAANTNIRYSASLTDLSARYAPLSYGASASATGITTGSGKNDLNTIFAAINTSYLLKTLLFAAGSTNNSYSGAVNTASLLNASTNTSSTTTSIVGGVAYASGTGNATKGLIGGGINSPDTLLQGILIYTYSSATWATPSSGASHMYEFMAAASTSSIAGFYAGLNISTIQQSGCYTYTYSSDTQAFTTYYNGSSGDVAGWQAAFSDGTYAYIGGGEQNNSSTTVLLRNNFSSGWTTMTSMPSIHDLQPGCAGNTAYGIWAGGLNGSALSSSVRFNVSANTWTSTGSLSVARYYLAGAPTNKNAYFGGGGNTGTTVYSTTDVVNFSTGTSSSGTNLAQGNVSTLGAAGWGGY